MYAFQQLQTIRSFDDSIVNFIITVSKANEKESNLLENILEINNKVRPKPKAKKTKIRSSFESIISPWELEKI